MRPAIDITSEQLKTLLSLLRQFIPGVAVWAYGSRVKWTARVNSDLDLVAFTKPEQRSSVYELKDALAESNLPFLVDLHIWDEVPEKFHEIIRKEYVVVQEKVMENELVAPMQWERERLADLCLQIADCPHSTPLWTNSGALVLRSQNIRNGRLDLSTKSYTDEAHFEQRSRRALLQGGDLVITREAPMGEVCLIPEGLRCCLGQRMVMLRPNPKKCDSRFLLYAIQSRSVQDEIKVNEGTGSTVSNLRIPLLEALPIPRPPLAEQKAIASILGALDDKIELNRRMNATLEAMARALFQSWFVDFDPVRAKLDGRQPTALDPATAALFPDSFQDSEVGHIPRDWKVGVLDDLTKFVIGGDWGATEPTEDEAVSCYCIRGADIPSLQSGGVGKMPTRFLKPSSVEKRQLADGDLAIEISGGSPTQCTGRPVLVSDALLQSLGLPLVASNFCRIVKLKSPALSKFVYLWLRQLYDAGELFQFETGTTGIKNFAFVIFSERYPLVVPDLRAAEAFDRTVSSYFARIQANSQESRTLATLRDTLLPKLLSGELRVDNMNSSATSTS